MQYKNCTPIRKGDSVLFEGGKTAGKVEAIVESVEDMQNWGVSEKGLMISAAEFGLVFWPASDVNDVTFLSST